ncbi:hypothetical protein DNU06_13375 [Putridiphycobacter roseus]|uniref:Uncharacterized protein n=1 Tax=Putridiphycobacter roseus TaxID=2219161 RepID=A0A2W1MW21_9FLAO|nr:T9SS type A sorting domain-containing protein [Putridiphycobacter roseus]PZE16299.1 hypothetical protein DNU06_13375 [Putridiphycobacter roseus]
MKNIYLALLFIFAFNFVQAQYVTIPDTNFVAFLQSNYSVCMNGNQMDTTCSDIVNAISLNCEGQGIINLEGAQYFDNIISLKAENNGLTILPNLPQSSLNFLYLNDNDFTTITSLPPNLINLNINNNPNLTSTPPISSSIINYYRGGTPNLAIPNFNVGLETIHIFDCNLSVVPTLPNTIKDFNIESNPNIGSISASSLPPSIIDLNINDCGLSVLPALPPNIEDLSCGGNSISTLGILPSTLKRLYVSDSPNITQLVNLPDTMYRIIAKNCNISYIDSLPIFMTNLIDISDNQLTSIPNFPEGLLIIDLSNNNISYVPKLPDNLTILRMENNNVSCWPVFPNLNIIEIFGNPFHCIPNYLTAMNVWSYLDTIPLCNFGNTSNNPAGCPSGQGITGYIFIDTATDCQFNGYETPFKNLEVKLFDSLGLLLETTASDIYGNYKFTTSNIGTYEVVIDTAGIPFLPSCLSPGVDSTVSITVADSLFDKVDFGTTCSSSVDYGTLGISTLGWVFPNQTHELTVNAGDLSQWYSMGCLTNQSGSVSITVNGPVTFLNEAPTSLIPLVSGTTYSYTIADFANVVNNKDFRLMFKTDSTAQSGDLICVTVNVIASAADIDSTNNTYTYCYSVANSYDPNDKQVYPRSVKPGYEDWLTYTIRFQNTGTAPAFNIRLEDTLSANLDYSTFEVIGYKHANSFNLVEDRLIVYFPNIMLVDSTTNYDESIGYFQYRIKPKAGLPVETIIENTAYIFFDFNDPIVTNTAVTTFTETDLSVGETTNFQFQVFPNPSNGNFYVQTEKYNDIKKVEVFNMMGQSVPVHYELNNHLMEINLKTATNGMLLLKVSSNNGVSTKRILIQE